MQLPPRRIPVCRAAAAGAARGGAGRGNHGLAHCRAPGQCGNSGAAAGSGSDRSESASGTRWHVGAIDALAKPSRPLSIEASLAALITAGNFEDDLAKLAECDWVIEAVAENLDIKTALLTRVVPHLARARHADDQHFGLADGADCGRRSPAHRERFFGTHFFNPPRYMRLLEIIPTDETDPALVAAFAAFADRILGKQVVFANDTPNFIANRIGVAVMFHRGEPDAGAGADD